MPIIINLKITSPQSLYYFRTQMSVQRVFTCHCPMSSVVSPSLRPLTDSPKPGSSRVILAAIRLELSSMRSRAHTCIHREQAAFSCDLFVYHKRCQVVYITLQLAFLIPQDNGVREKFPCQ